MTPALVGKVGGSLFDLADLAARLGHWLANEASQRIILIPGGGAGADVIRQLDGTHGIGDEAAHWLALRVLGVNADFLARLIGVPVVKSILEASGHRTCVLDPHEFCRRDEGQKGALPHSWNVTSDAIAARVAALVRG